MSSDVKIAIDPGRSGAMAVRYPDGKVAVFPFTDECEAILDLEGVMQSHRWGQTSEAVLERVHSMPGQGVSSTFKFGANYGFWRGVLQALRVPFREVTPQSWQKGYLVSGKLKGNERKKALRQIAFEKYPELKPTMKTADALLMLDA